jgi:uncharacterized protein
MKKKEEEEKKKVGEMASQQQAAAEGPIDGVRLVGGSWLNEPSQWKLENEGAELAMTTGGKTDFWRVTRHGFIKDDGHFYGFSVEGDFTATVRVAGEYGQLYDQAGLMVRESEKVWLKCGVEFVEGVQQASAVITREVSDWSVLPLPDNPPFIWIRVQRFGSAVEVFFSRDGSHFTLIRQAFLSSSSSLLVGPMAAAPQGDGFQAHFSQFHLQLSSSSSS